MTRAVRREMPDQVIQAAHLYLNARLGEAAAKRDKGDKRHGPYATLAAWCRTHGIQDDKGSWTCKFPVPLSIGGKKYAGLKLQASQPSPYWDEEKAKALIDSLGPDATAAATHTEIIYDYDYLYLLLQQEKIDGGDLDDVLITPDREYSLTVLEEK